MDPVGVDQQCDCHRQRGEGELADGDERAPGIATRNRGCVAGGRGGDRHLQHGVRGLRQRQPAQQSEQAGEAPGAKFVDAFPELDGGGSVPVLGASVEQRGDDPQHADREDRHRVGHDPQIADADCDGHANDRAGDGTDEQRSDRRKQRLDQGGADFLGKLRIRFAGLNQSLYEHGLRAVLRSATIACVTDHKAN